MHYHILEFFFFFFLMWECQNWPKEKEIQFIPKSLQVDCLFLHQVLAYSPDFSELNNLGYH